MAPPPPPHATASPSHQSRRRLALIGLATAGVVSIVFGFGLYFWPSGSSPSPEAPATEAAATEAAPETPTKAAPAKRAAAARPDREQATARTSSALDAAQIPLTGSRAASRYAGGSGGSRQGTGTSASAAAVPALTSVAGEPEGSAGTDAARVPPQAPQTRGGAPLAAGASAPEPSSPTPIYSASDATVQPALLARPQLLPPMFADTTGKPVRLELIISPAGTVERARFLATPQRMADMMLLSSAKTWQFTPALKDGRPVRYRTVVSWVAAP